jgi:hypothetical protein
VVITSLTDVLNSLKVFDSATVVIVIFIFYQW